MRDFSVFDDLIDGYQIVDTEMRYLYLNKVLLSEIKMKKDEILGKEMTEKFPGIESTLMYEKIKTCLIDRVSSKAFNEFTFSDGTLAIYELSFQSIDEGVLIVSRNVSAEEKGRDFLKETERELELFSHFVSHELREPIRRISILSEEVLLDYSESVPKELVEINMQIHEQAQRLLKLIAAVREISAFGTKDVEKEEISVLKLAKEVAEETLKDSEKKSVTFHWPTTDAIVSGDPYLVRILLRNLFENAVLYGENEIKFDIELDECHKVHYLVSNPSTQTIENPELMLLPFMKGRSSQGTGIGLNLVKKIIDKHKGSIKIELKDGRFTVAFSLG